MVLQVSPLLEGIAERSGTRKKQLMQLAFTCLEGYSAGVPHDLLINESKLADQFRALTTEVRLRTACQLHQSCMQWHHSMPLRELPVRLYPLSCPSMLTLPWTEPHGEGEAKFEGMQADRSAFLEHALRLMLWNPSYSARARVDPNVSARDSFVAEFMNNHARLTVRCLSCLPSNAWLACGQCCTIVAWLTLEQSHEAHQAVCRTRARML